MATSPINPSDSVKYGSSSSTFDGHPLKYSFVKISYQYQQSRVHKDHVVEEVDLSIHLVVCYLTDLNEKSGCCTDHKTPARCDKFHGEQAKADAPVSLQIEPDQFVSLRACLI